MPSTKEVADYYKNPNRWKIVVYSPVYLLYFIEQKKRIMNLVLRNVKVSKEKRLLDAGCGYGRYTQPLAELFDVYALDVSSEMLELVKRFTKKTFQGDLTKTGFKNKYFDVVFCMDVTNHLESLDTALGEFHRILKNGGYLFINITNPRSMTRPMSILLKKIFDFFHVTLGTPISRFYTISDFERMVKNKFEIVEVVDHKIVALPKIIPFQNTIALKKI